MQQIDAKSVKNIYITCVKYIIICILHYIKNINLLQITDTSNCPTKV